MVGRSVGLKILFWSETIISVRILLFTIPVMMNKIVAKSFHLSNGNDSFIALLSTTAVFYVFVGIASILGFRYLKAVHYLAAVVTLSLTVGSLNLLDQSSASAGVHYFYPVLMTSYRQIGWI